MPTPDNGPVTPLAPPPRAAVPRRRRISFLGLALAGLVGAAAASWVMGYSPRRLLAMARSFSTPAQNLPTFTVETGDISLEVVESGTLESANSVPVKCQVKALLGTVNSAVGNMQQAGNSRGGNNRSSSSASSSQPRMAGTAGQIQGKTAGTTKGAVAKGATGAAGAAGTSSAGGSGMSGTATAGSSVVVAPIIRSFTYVVAPYVPLRGATATAGRASTVSSAAMAPQGGGGGGGGMQERSGSTRILSILPEGSHVKKGDIVCGLDDANFVNELAVQKIKWAQAKSWVDQANEILAVNEIALNEYKDGILPQDRLLIQQYIATCKTQLQKAADDLAYGRKLYAQGLKTASQVKADVFNHERAEIALREANGMLRRLDKFTAPRLLINLEAKLASIRSDVLAQEAAFLLEDQRLKDIQKMIQFCTLRAPLDGVVVYANQANAWGRVDDQIREGVAVREGQPIFTIPDSNRMRVKARVNESKYNSIEIGQEVEVTVDAYPDRPFQGRVTELTAIPAPAAGPISDVKIYYAMININNAGFQDLRPGMSAEVRFDRGSHTQVTRLPVQAIRRSGREAFVAVPSAKGYRWQPVELGVSNASYVEIRSGVKPGERVVADPRGLSEPPGRRAETAARHASLSNRS